MFYINMVISGNLMIQGRRGRMYLLLITTYPATGHNKSLLIPPAGHYYLIPY